MQNNFSYKNNQQCDFQMNYDYYAHSFQQQHVPPQQVEASNGPSYREVMILMDVMREKLGVIDERLRGDQRCKNIEQEWHENKQILFNMLEDASNKNFVELVIIVNTTL